MKKILGILFLSLLPSYFAYSQASSSIDGLSEAGYSFFESYHKIEDELRDAELMYKNWPREGVKRLFKEYVIEPIKKLLLEKIKPDNQDYRKLIELTSAYINRPDFVPSKPAPTDNYQQQVTDPFLQRMMNSKRTDNHFLHAGSSAAYRFCRIVEGIFQIHLSVLS